jgi:acyl carrier protein
VVSEEAQAGADALRAHIAQRLPSHMVPSLFVFLPGLPLTANGKLDRKALPRPVADDTAYEAPRTDTERALCRIWADVLGLPAVGAHDNFFQLGGHSLSAVRVAFRLSEELGRTIKLATLFAHPTVAALAQRLNAPDPASGRLSAVSLSSLLEASNDGAAE